MSDERVMVDVRDRVGTITIHRPEVRNALDTATLIDLEAALSAVEADDDVRVIVLTGAGEHAFVAGGDITEIATNRGIGHFTGFAEVIHRVFNRFEDCDKPTIAAVHGYALGGGLELLLTLDIRILSESAVLAFPEIGLGLFPGAGGSQRAIRQVPLCRAKELLFTGDRFGAEEAVALGLANRVVAKEDLLQEAVSLGQRIAEKSPLVLKLLKRTIRDGLNMPPRAALAHEHAMISLVLDTEDAHEGCDAFVEKRKPTFEGR